MIYVLRLQQNKYFVYFSDEMKMEKQIMIESEIYYDYVKKYKPISIIETIPFIDHFDIDKTVKHYMYYHGYDNVRGGSYIDEILPDYLEKTINHEFKLVDTETLECEYLFKEIIEKYENKNYENIEEISKEIDELSEEFRKYSLEKKSLDKIKVFYINGEKMYMKKFIPEDMDWLYEICLLNTKSYSNKINHTRITDILNSSYVSKYKKNLVYLKQLYVIFLHNDLFSKFNIEKSPYLKNPEFIFDGFIYDTPSKDTDNLEKICKTFSLMGNIVYNIIMEREHDVMSYHIGYEWKIPRILYILEKKREKFGKAKLIFDEPFI